MSSCRELKSMCFSGPLFCDWSLRCSDAVGVVASAGIDADGAPNSTSYCTGGLHRLLAQQYSSFWKSQCPQVIHLPTCKGIPMGNLSFFIRKFLKFCFADCTYHIYSYVIYMQIVFQKKQVSGTICRKTDWRNVKFACDICIAILGASTRHSPATVQEKRPFVAQDSNYMLVAQTCAWFCVCVCDFMFCCVDMCLWA